MSGSDERWPEMGWVEGPGGPLFVSYWAPVPRQEATRAHAVLLCEPFGPDRMNLHRAYRRLAARFSAAGFPVLRFDPTGTGDASGSPRDPAWPGGWWSEADACVRFLRARSGCTRLAAFGARFGGTLATTLEGVDSLMLWGPHRDGATFLRAERALAAFIDTNAGGRRSPVASPDDAEWVGYVYPPGARRLIRDLDPANAAGDAPARARLLGWDEGAEEGSIEKALAARGTQVSRTHLDGVDGDLCLQQQRVPEPVIDDLVAWLSSVDLEGDVRRVVAERPAPILGSSPVARDGRDAVRVQESVVRFGDDDGLFGIATSPGASHADRAEARRPGLVLVTGGNNHRPGINRNHTEWARDVALAGRVALRFDIRGIGESPAERPEHENVLHRSETKQDVLDAARWLTESGGASSAVLCGLCAGAYQALHAAEDSASVSGIVLLDLLRWDQDGPAEPRMDFWTRRREELARVWAARPGAEESMLAQRLRRVTERGVRVLMISCVEGGASRRVLDALGNARADLEATGRFELEILRDTNHVFTPLWAQHWLGTRLRTFLDEVEASDSIGDAHVQGGSTNAIG